MKIINKPGVGKINMPRCMGSKHLRAKGPMRLGVKLSKFELNVLAAIFHAYQHHAEVGTSMECTREVATIYMHISSIARLIGKSDGGAVFERITAALKNLSYIHIDFENGCRRIYCNLLNFTFFKEKNGADNDWDYYEKRGSLRISVYRVLYDAFFNYFARVDYDDFLKLTQNEKIVFLQLISSSNAGAGANCVTDLLNAVRLQKTRKNVGEIKKILRRLMHFSDIKFINLKKFDGQGKIWFEMAGTRE